MKPIAVDCIFEMDGSVRIRRIQGGDGWQTVEQGRQWQDAEGRHVLILLQGTFVREIVLNGEDLRWRLKEGEARGPKRA